MNKSRIKRGDLEIRHNGGPTKHYTKLNNVIHLNSLSGLITTRSFEISKKTTVKLAERIFTLIIGMTLTQFEIPNFSGSTVRDLLNGKQLKPFKEMEGVRDYSLDR